MYPDDVLTLCDHFVEALSEHETRRWKGGGVTRWFMAAGGRLMKRNVVNSSSHREQKLRVGRQPCDTNSILPLAVGPTVGLKTKPQTILLISVV